MVWQDYARNSDIKKIEIYNNLYRLFKRLPIGGNVSDISEIKEFLAEYKVAGLAIAFIIAIAVTSLVQSFVKDIIMPLIPHVTVYTNTDASGQIVPIWVDFFGQLIIFVILVFIVYLIAKWMIKEEKITKK